MVQHDKREPGLTMCGIAGIVQLNQGPVDSALLERMTKELAHRGPDGEGYVLLAQGGEKPLPVRGSLHDSVRGGTAYTIGLGHRRLAIVDLTPLGHQPMGTEDGRLWITYNGEIYNAPELRQELIGLGHPFRSSSDTEVLLKAYRQWGRHCLERLNGMFAFALWDDHEGVLFAARDRFGIKPFYYRREDARFLFASEVKALLCDSSFIAAPYEPAVYEFLTRGKQDHTRDTFFRDIQQLTPGEWLMLRPGASKDSRLAHAHWWSVPTGTFSVSEDEAVTRTRELLEDSVRLQLRADVPVGSCLSGGLDSSSIVCLMAALLEGKPRPQTFSSIQDNPRFDERRYLRAVVARTGVLNREVLPDPTQLWESLPHVLWHQDEPIAGTSVLAQWTVMQAAGRNGVKVLLDGQGGDELLLGYPRHFGLHLADLIKTCRWVEAIREWQAWRQVHGSLHPTAVAGAVRGLLPESTAGWLRRRVTGEDGWLAPGFRTRVAQAARTIDGTCSRMAQQTIRILERDLPALLHYEDRNAMAFSVEARVPFLDHRLVEWLLTLPADFKLRRGITKRVLRKAMAGKLPDEVQSRTDKMGFVTPEDYWLRVTWRDKIERMLESESLRSRPYWRAPALKEWYRRYRDGQAGGGATLWRCLSVETWLRRFCD
jgi:asparagine synthase (glutamine-hydrolysing)